MKILLHYKIRPIILALSVSTPVGVLAQNKSDETSALFDLPLNELMNVEITTAGKTREKIKDIPASVIIVTRKDIERYGYTTLTEVLENVPGLYNIYSYTGAPGNFGVRGFSNPTSQNSSVAFLVNGVRQINDDLRANPIDKITVPVEAIDRVEIIKGPMAVMYGSNASFGVINIITNETKNDISLASVTYGSRNTGKLALRITEKINNLEFVVNASAYETDGTDNKFSDMISTPLQPILPAVGVTNPNYSTKGLLEHSNEYFAIAGTYNNLYFDFAYNNTDVDTYALYPSLVDGIEHNVESSNFMLGYADKINQWFSLDGKIIYSTHDRLDNTDIVDPTQPGFSKLSYDSLEAELLSTIKPNDAWVIVAGLNQRTMKDNIHQSFVPSIGLNPALFERDDRTTRALFGQATYTPNNQWKLVAGLRWENNMAYTRSGIDDIGTPAEKAFSGNVDGDKNILPRIAVVHHLNDSHTLKLLYGEASKLVEDKTNNPESTKTLEINHIYTKHKITINTSVFHNELEDLFTTTIVNDPVNGIQSQQSRGGELSTNGIETIINGFLTNNLRGELGITFQKSKDDFTNLDVAYSPETLAHAKVDYTHNSTIYALMGRYVGSMLSSFGSIIPPFSEDLTIRAGDKSDGYFVLDANLRQNKVFDNGYYNIRITNILDEEIRYPNNTALTSLLDKGTIGTERSIYGTIGWKF